MYGKILEHLERAKTYHSIQGDAAAGNQSSHTEMEGQ
jgi:hypothetical protein